MKLGQARRALGVTALVFLTTCLNLNLVQAVEPTNNTTGWASPEDAERIGLAFQPTRGPFVIDALIPLTREAANNLPVIRIDSASNSWNTLNTTDIAFVDCDPSSLPGYIDIATLLVNIASKNTSAILLYSTTSNFCRLTSPNDIPSDYSAVFSLTDASDSSRLDAALQRLPEPLIGIIDQRSALSAMSNNSQNEGPLTGSQNPGGPSPSTNTAMIILYSITGLITALFLVIIITGAIRAHRHPERYGPRNVLGRPRQSRARGLGRAILETIPIVKFGDPEPDTNKTADVELAENSNSHPETSEVREAHTGEPLINPEATASTAAKSAESSAEESPGPGPAAAQNSSNDHLPVDDPALGCSICTDDFERGQDVRLLPCNHKFHPACIDPWLLNVSGTCPLCRIDLRPVTSHSTSDTLDPAAASRRGSFAPPLDANEDGHGSSSNRASRRLSAFLDVLNPRRMQDAPPEERIAALRRVRERERERGEENEAETRRRRRISARLGSVFNVRTGSVQEERNRSREPSTSRSENANSGQPSQDRS
ncbi:hypothetical protein K402DRAFT_414334 [Aulographum hederae CBS 113979]|uniref:RING-type E3 ubiquitin transferase n=1 Tax=Aulographum hederae CBS 113979 TaxID=1176131 RepID=A0A6G1GRX8_9PEZI|nr:hypothetical protein K402DRAFT_414334 [Aulographum hederae CBS 113979]